MYVYVCMYACVYVCMCACVSVCVGTKPDVLVMEVVTVFALLNRHRCTIALQWFGI